MKNKLKTLIVLVLAVSMTLSFAACGSTKQEVEETPEYVYSASFEKLNGNSSGSMSVLAYTADGAYASSYEVEERVIPEGLDTTGMSEDELRQYDKYVMNLYFIGNDGSASKVANYKKLPAKTNDEGFKEFNSDSYMTSLSIDKDDNLLAVEQVYSSWYDGPDGKTWADDDYYNYYHYEQNYFLRRLDPTGAELSCVPLDIGPDQYIYGKLLTDEAGNILTSNDMNVMAFNAEGGVEYMIDCGNYVQSLVTLADGKNYVIYWGDNGCEMAPIDAATKSIGKATALPGNAYDVVTGGGDYDMYFTDGLYFCGYDIETETTDKLFNWIDCDVNSDYVNNVEVADDGSVSGIICEYDPSDQSYSNERFTVSKVPSSSLPKKETLTLACMWLDYDVRAMLIKFNRSSQTTRISIQDYSQYNTEDDYEAGTKKFLTTVMAGDSADIISLNGLPYRQIAAKGLLEDLYPYIDKETEFKRADFFPNLLSALEVGGKLYSTCPAFSVSTVIGSKKVIGDKTSWTYDDLDAALATMPEGCQPFDQYTTRDDILRTCLSLDMDSYVNWETGECNFGGEQFVKLLEFANRFPENYEYTEDYTAEDSSENRIKTGKQLLMRTSIYGVDGMDYNTISFGGETVYIGYPTLSGNGNMLAPESGYAMSSTCKNKDAAWEFLRTFYTEKYQKSAVWSIPSNIEVYKDKIAEAMTIRYMRDEKGEIMLDENGEKIMQPRYSMGNENGETINVYAMTQEQADELWNVVTSTTKLYSNDDSIFSIVSEQAAAYFAGQKSAEEVAKLVQSKAQIYVSEQG